MNCPRCGDNNAVVLLTSIQCSDSRCDNFNHELAIEVQMRNFTWDVTQSTYGTQTGRFSSKSSNLSNLPKPGSIQKALLSMREENKRLREDNLKLAESIRRVNFFLEEIDGVKIVNTFHCNLYMS